MRTLEHDQERMYHLTERDNSSIVLEVVVGSIGMYEVAMPLISEEIARYRSEGKSFIDDLAYDVARKSQTKYAERFRGT